MEYQLFCEQLKQGILNHADWKIEEKDYLFYKCGFTSDNEEELTFIRETNWKYHLTKGDVLLADYIVLLVMVDEMQVQCRYQVKLLYREYMEKGWEHIWNIIDEQLKLITNSNVYTPMKSMEKYEEMKERLIIRAINYTDHEYELRNVVYKVCGDIALVLYAILYDNELGLGTTKITKKNLEEWGKNMDEVFEEALWNTNIKAMPWMYRNVWELFDEKNEGEAFMTMNQEVKMLETHKVPTITTNRKMNGAVAMFYPGVQERIAELFGADYYVAFTSIHEAKVHHVDSVNPSLVFEALSDVNETFPREEILSRNVFRYDHNTKKLEIVDIKAVSPKN